MVAEDALEPPSHPTVAVLRDDRASARQRHASDLVAVAAGNRDQLEELRAGILRRLHQARDDFGAAERLRVVELALRMVPRVPDIEVGPAGPRHYIGSSWWRRRRRRPYS